MSHISFVEMPCSVVSSKVLIVDCRPLSCSATPISLFVHYRNQKGNAQCNACCRDD